MKTKVLELEDNQYLYVHFHSKELVNYINGKTDFEVVKTRYIDHCGNKEKERYRAEFVRHGRPLNYEYCVLKVDVGFANDIYLLCKDVEMRQARSTHPLIYLDRENVLMVSTKKSKCIDAYNEKKEQYSNILGEFLAEIL